MSGWQPVIDPRTGRYPDGFDENAVNEFRRGSEGDVQRFRLADVGPLFNVAGLYWRDPA